MDADTLELNAILTLQLSDYWHEVDLNQGRNAGEYYTEDAVFHGPFASYEGREEIEKFYAWRASQGPRLSVHSFTNFRARFIGKDKAEATNYLFLYVANGEAPLPSQVPATISLVTDHYLREKNGSWLCTYRHFRHLFESGTPVTNPDISDIT